VQAQWFAALLSVLMSTYNIRTMKTFRILTLSLLILATTACEKLEQEPSNNQSTESLTDLTGVLNAAYYYQIGTVTPMAVMGDFRADNAYMDESPYSDFDVFNSDLPSMEEQFFGPFYTASYRSILSANTVIEKSGNSTQIGEAKFLRALTYFKMVRVFGDVSVILTPQPSVEEIPNVDLTRQPASSVYTNVIIPDLEDAITRLGSGVNGRASQAAAQGLLGKVYMQLGEFNAAEPYLEAVVNGSGASLLSNYEEVFSKDLNDEVLFSTQISSSIVDEYGFTEFWSWYLGLDTKSLTPCDPSRGPTIFAAFDEVAGDTIPGVGVDLRRAITIDEGALASAKYPDAQDGGEDVDWIELRLADVILLYAEARNENGASASEALGLLDDIRERAGLVALDPTTINTQELVRDAILNERRLELAFEGQRWFDLVRTGTVDAAMGESVDPNYYVFPIPNSEVLVSDDIIQNPGY